jgi:hypothetical protein
LKQKDFENSKDFKIILSSLTYLHGLVIDYKHRLKYVHRKHPLLIGLEYTEGIVDFDSLDFSKVEYEEIQDVINNFVEFLLLEDFASVNQALQWLLDNDYSIFTKIQLKIFRMSFYYFIRLMRSKDEYELKLMLRESTFIALRQYRHFLEKITMNDVINTAAKLGITEGQFNNLMEA